MRHFREMSPDTFWLLRWALGGFIVMSLIPSKRVDRIFPVLPPLCLLLAVQVGSYLSSSYGAVSRSGIDVDSNLAGHPASPDHGEADTPVATANCAMLYLSMGPLWRLLCRSCLQAAT